MGGEWSLLGEIFSGGGMSKVLARGGIFCGGGNGQSLGGGGDSPSKENPVDCCATP